MPAAAEAVGVVIASRRGYLQRGPGRGSSPARVRRGSPRRTLLRPRGYQSEPERHRDRPGRRYHCSPGEPGRSALPVNVPGWEEIMLQSVHPPATDAPHGTHTSALKKTIAGLFDSSFRGSPGPCLRPLLKSYFEALLSHARIDLPDEDPILFKAVFLLPLPSISDAIAAVTRRISHPSCAGDLRGGSRALARRGA